MASASRNDENFQLGQTDEFIIQSKEIGNLQKIKWESTCHYIRGFFFRDYISLSRKIRLAEIYMTYIEKHILKIAPFLNNVQHAKMDI